MPAPKLSAAQAKEVLTQKPRTMVSPEGGLSIGTTLLNLACTDRPDVGFLKGCYYLFVGDSSSGKTWICMSCFAEACLNPAFKKYKLIFDNVENGALMDVEYYFGKAAKSRIQPPSMKNGKPVMSDTVESFYYHVQHYLDKGEPFIYILDSQDSLSSDAAAKKFQKKMAAHNTDKEVAGSMGDGKAKYHSEHLREVVAQLRDTGSILIIVSQTRENLGFGFDPKTRSGGKALRFYATAELWSSIKGMIKKTINGKERTLGTKCMVEVKKNRVSGKIGKDRSVIIPIYNGLGIDDVGANVDYLIDEQKWLPVEDASEKNPVIDATDIMFQGTRAQIVKYIESESLEEKVKGLTAKLWEEIEEKCMPTNRKRRYE